MELIPYSDFQFGKLGSTESVSFAHERSVLQIFAFILVESLRHVYLYDIDRWDAVVNTVKGKRDARSVLQL